MYPSMRGVSLLAAAVVATSVAARADAQDAGERCQSLEEPMSVDNSLTLAQLRFNAVLQARNRLLQSLGVEVRGTTEMLRGGTRDSSYTVVTQGISQETTGWITRDTVLDWRTTDGGRTYTLKYQGCARTTVGKRDPSFFAEVALNKDPPAYLDNGPGRRDSIVVGIRVSQPAFVTVFFRTADTLTVLYPSVAIGAPSRAQLVSGGELRVPPPGNRLRTTLQSGSRKTLDWIVVVVTRQDIPLDLQPLPPGELTLQKLTWHEYLRWLNRIPLEERFVTERPFTIERTR